MDLRRPSERSGAAASADHRPLYDAEPDDDGVVSDPGRFTAAEVTTDGGDNFTAVSVYAISKGTIGHDAAAHRILSDLSALLRRRRPPHRLIVAGDRNVFRGYGEFGNNYAKARYETVFDRAEALGLRFVGPESPKRAAGGPVAGPASPRQPLRADLSQQPTETGHRDHAARLRLRLDLARGPGRGARAHHTKRLGPKRPLPRPHRR